MKKLSLILFLSLACLPFLQAERLVSFPHRMGKTYWRSPTPPAKCFGLTKTAGPQRGHTGHHDAHLLPNGNILFHDTWTTLKEITLDKKVVWEYDYFNSNGNKGKRVDACLCSTAERQHPHCGEQSRTRDRSGQEGQVGPLLPSQTGRDDEFAPGLGQRQREPISICSEQPGVVTEYDEEWKSGLGLSHQDPCLWGHASE